MPNNATGDIFDDNGFLTDPNYWDRDLALAIAAYLGIGELSEAHWALVDKLRDRHMATGVRPRDAQICRELGLGHACIRRLFGASEAAWKIAGLPDPGETARADLLDADLDTDMDPDPEPNREPSPGY